MYLLRVPGFLSVCCLNCPPPHQDRLCGVVPKRCRFCCSGSIYDLSRQFVGNHFGLFACALLAVGCLLRVKVTLLARLFVPASVVAGAVGLAVLQWGVQIEDSTWREWFQGVSGELRTWPG